MTTTYLALCGTDVIAFGEALADVLANARACLEGESDVVLWCDAPGGVTALALLRKDGERLQRRDPNPDEGPRLRRPGPRPPAAGLPRRPAGGAGLRRPPDRPGRLPRPALPRLRQARLDLHPVPPGRGLQGPGPLRR